MRTRLRGCGVLAACALLSSRVLAQAAPEAFDLVAEISQGTPMTADQAAQRAQQVAPSIERAEALTQAALASEARARTLLWPRLEVSARVAHIDGFPDGVIGGMDPDALAAAEDLAGMIQDPASRQLWTSYLEQQGAGGVFKIPRNQVGFSGRLTWPVSDIFLAVMPTIDAAESNVRANEAERDARNGRVRLLARESFFQLARARGNLAVAQRAVVQTKAQQELIDAGVRVGIRPPSEAASAASRVALAEQALSASETNVDVADATLRSLLEDNEGPVYAISQPLITSGGEPASLKQLLDKARAQRPEVRGLRAAVEARKRQSKADRAAAYPHLGVYAGADYAMPNRYQLPPRSEFQPSWEIGASLTYAPNDTLTADRRSTENNAQIAAIEAELGELLRSLDLEVRRSRVTLAHSQRNIDAAQTAVTAAEAAYTRRMAELHAGQVVLADVVASEQELNAARLRMLDAGIDQQLARVRLAYALGE
ncbi:MAG TPA: TolC family protein [Polyangiales bacterium]|nr:TolC family protein [Polyangiales bacterium]